jgi:hypothetical protein
MPSAGPKPSFVSIMSVILTRSSVVFLLNVAFAAGAAPPSATICCENAVGQRVAVASDPSVDTLFTSRTASGVGPFEWPPSETEHSWRYVVIHHSATNAGSVSSIHNEHRQRKDRAGNNWLGIGYHFVIGNGNGMEDGKIESTFRWKQQIHGAHSGSTVHNANGIGICLIGNFQNNAPTANQLKSVRTLIGQLSNRYQIPARLVIGHNTVKSTDCPGKYFRLQEVVRDTFSRDRVNS